ncbi:MAG TPA: hypothetical protein PLB89_05170 [Flavobacteriales bacterium]|nr:hypothetical protein [Flavobacteriales bacterium]
MDQHQRLGTLAEKLEFSNALRKQLERELSKERIEHGQTKALADEQEHELKMLRGLANQWKVTPEDRERMRKDQVVKSLKGRAARLLSICKGLRKSNRELIEKMCRMEREAAQGSK